MTQDSLNDDILAEYLGECYENIGRVSVLLSKLEKEGFSADNVRTIKRDMHTIKGSSQLFGYQDIGEVAHIMEHGLELLKNHSESYLDEITEIVYQGVDLLTVALESVKSKTGVKIEAERILGFKAQMEKLTTKAELKVSQGEMLPGLERALPKEYATAKPGSPDEGHSDTIRVHVNVLNSLMNLVGELVIVRNQLIENTRDSEDQALLRVGQRLNAVSTELQDQVIKTRLQPLSIITNHYHRLVRDTAKSLRKSIRLELLGGETEVDKTLIEAVRDPLMHIVRNAIDHGIESPSERSQKGKAEEGFIQIKAYHESGHVVIEIRDDGAGISALKVRNKAIEKGLVKAEDMDRLRPEDWQNFIFLPGFSTADQISHLSGRGVGMDIVKNNVELIGGHVSLESIESKGTTVRLSIPLTLAIIPALLIQAGGMRFAIPQVKLVELIQWTSESSPTSEPRLEFLDEQPFLRLRGKLLPLIAFNRIIREKWDAQEFRSRLQKVGGLSIVVLREGPKTFGLIVEDIHDSLDIVVKPLSNIVKDIGIYSGASIMGDGQVALTLDVAGVAAKVGELRSGSESARAELLTQDKPRHNPDIVDAEFLLLSLGTRGLYAVPLALVYRLEEFGVHEVENLGLKRYVKYGHKLLKLISALEYLCYKSESGINAAISTVVIRAHRNFYGLEVDQILDVVHISQELQPAMDGDLGLLGSFIYQNRVVAILDVLNLVNDHAKDQGKGFQEQELKLKRGQNALWLLEENTFLRQKIGHALRKIGYRVVDFAYEKGRPIFRAQDLLQVEKPGGIICSVNDGKIDELGWLSDMKARWVAPEQSPKIYGLSFRHMQGIAELSQDWGPIQHFNKFSSLDLIDALDKDIGIEILANSRAS